MRETNTFITKLWRGGLLRRDQQDISRWWEAVCDMAGWVANGGSESDLTGTPVKHRLLEKGYVEAEVERAFAWVEKTSVSGTLTASLSMLQPQGQGPRISHPVERSYFSEKVWLALGLSRSRGLITPDLYERLIESIRCLDTRGWDDCDVLQILSQMYVASVPHARSEDFSTILSGLKPTQYC